MRAGRGLLVGVALLGLAACEGTGPAVGTVRLHLTDAPAPNIASAVVWISRAELSPGGFVVTDVPQAFDLLLLQGGVTALLGTATIPVGDYSQLRLIVDSARITLDAGFTFADGSSEAVLTVPSGMQTGIKVNFSGPVHVAPGETSIVIDFDVARSFVFQGGSPPSGASFKPVIHAVGVDVAGSISGTSLPVSARGKLLAILGSDTVARSLADTLTGAYTLYFLPPGTYTVADSAVGYQVATQVVVVGPAQHVTGVNFTLVP